jgi:orotate phosphoribosyltransferase
VQVEDRVEVVVAPAIGGVILSQWTAYHLSKITGRNVYSIYAEKTEGGDSFVIRRGYGKIVAGKNVLIMEDVLTTGGSVKKVVEATRTLGGNIVGFGAFCNRGGIAPEDVGTKKIFALINIRLDAWNEAECPLCVRGVPINIDIGKGKEYMVYKKVKCQKISLN